LQVDNAQSAAAAAFAADIGHRGGGQAHFNATLCAPAVGAGGGLGHGAHRTGWRVRDSVSALSSASYEWLFLNNTSRAGSVI
jgi:hypothetical protein